MTAKKKQLSFESAIERLEEITADLEGGETSLEDSITLYTEGLEIARQCNARLEEAEKKIKIITEKNGAPIEADFDAGEDL